MIFVPYIPSSSQLTPAYKIKKTERQEQPFIPLIAFPILGVSYENDRMKRRKEMEQNGTNTSSLNTRMEEKASRIRFQQKRNKLVLGMTVFPCE